MTDLESRLRSALYDETSPIAARPTLADDMVQRGVTVRRRRRLAAGAACAAVVLAVFPIWRSVDTGAERFEPVQPTPTASTTTLPDTPEPSLPPFSRNRVVVLHTPSTPPRVLSVRTGQHAGFDRVVIDFTGPLPTYLVDFRRELVGASGEPSPLPGSSLVLIRLSPATAHTESGQSPFDAREPVELTLPSVRGYAIVEDFDGTVSFGLSLNRFAPLRVFELSSPHRLVIDVRH